MNLGDIFQSKDPRDHERKVRVVEFKRVPLGKDGAFDTFAIVEPYPTGNRRTKIRTDQLTRRWKLVGSAVR